MNSKSAYRQAMKATPKTEFERRFFMYLAGTGTAPAKSKTAGR